MKKVIYSQTTTYELDPIYAGIQIVRKKDIQFNWKEDDREYDVISLVDDVSGTFDKNNTVVVYGYKYNDGTPEREIKLVRNFLKDLGTGGRYAQDVDLFVENGVSKLDEYYPLNDFAVAVCTDSSKHPSLVDTMGGYIAEYSKTKMATITLVKETYDNVQFDTEKARKAMENSERNHDSMYIHNQIIKTKKKFEELKESGELFKMKMFIPRELREGFSNFLKFGSEEQKKMYEALQGVNVLIYDDFYTSGTTIAEAIRVLNSLNDRNKIVVFVLVKQ